MTYTRSDSKPETHSKADDKQEGRDSKQFSLFGKSIPAADYLSFMSTEDISFHFGQSAEDVILLRLFHSKMNGFYIDVGAFHPRKYSNTFLLHHVFDWHGVNIDASSETIKAFDAERPNDINVHSAVGLKKETKTFYKFDLPARNTLSESNLKRQQLKHDVKLVGEEQITVRPLADILNEHVTPGTEIDVMNIDIEGYDLQALQSNDWSLFRPKVVLIEDYDFLQADKKRDSLRSFLEKLGYILRSHTFDTSIYIDTKNQTNMLGTGKIGSALKSNLEAASASSGTSARAALLTESYMSFLNTTNLDLLLQAKVEYNNKLREQLAGLKTDLAKMETKAQELRELRNQVQVELKTIVNSPAWKYTQALRSSAHYLKNRVGKKV